MSRRQREGRGGKDHHGCGNAQCYCCGNRRPHDGETRPELVARLEQKEAEDDDER